jgi:hypothetical protein
MQTPDIPPQSSTSEPVIDSLGAGDRLRQVDPPKKSGGFLSKVKTLISALLLIAISSGIGYGVGVFQSRSQIKKIQTEQKTALAEAQTQIEAAQSKVGAAEARSQLTQVRLGLLESVNELDQNNFGNANTLLRQASETLNKIEISKNPEMLAKLKEELSTAEINFAVNPVEQRKLMLNYSKQIEALLPE